MHSVQDVSSKNVHNRPDTFANLFNSKSLLLKYSKASDISGIELGTYILKGVNRPIEAPQISYW